MSGDYEVGDFVLVRGQVLKVFDSDVGYLVEFFSKTDQYHCAIRPDLVVGLADAPATPEPDRKLGAAQDASGDFWVWFEGNETEGIGWKAPGVFPMPWFEAVRAYGPMKIFELVDGGSSTSVRDE